MFFQEIALGRPDTEFSHTNEHDKGCGWIYNHIGKCDAAEVMQRIAKMEKFPSTHALRVHFGDYTSSTLLANVNPPAKWAATIEVYATSDRIKDKMDDF